jgi:hypothetical protein
MSERKTQNEGELRIPEIEKTFTHVPTDLHEILVLDSIDHLSDPPRFRIRSHDLYGSLPDILINDSGDRYPVLDKIQNEAAKQVAVVRVRRELNEMFPGCEFMLPTSSENSVIVGISYQGRTIMVEERSFWKACIRLKEKALQGRL